MIPPYAIPLDPDMPASVELAAKALLADPGADQGTLKRALEATLGALASVRASEAHLALQRMTLLTMLEANEAAREALQGKAPFWAMRLRGAEADNLRLRAALASLLLDPRLHLPDDQRMRLEALRDDPTRADLRALGTLLARAIQALCACDTPACRAAIADLRDHGPEFLIESLATKR